jgi:hypothetical protein
MKSSIFGRPKVYLIANEEPVDFSRSLLEKVLYHENVCTFRLSISRDQRRLCSASAQISPGLLTSWSAEVRVFSDVFRPRNN